MTKVSEIMNKVMVTDGDINLRKAAEIMSSKGIGCLIVINGEKVVGIITERDVLKNVEKLSSKLSAVMSKNVLTVDEHESIDNAAIIMSENKIKRLPVLHKGKLVGIVTATDLLANSDSLNENFLLG